MSAKIKVFSEVSFRDFADMAKLRGHAIESLADRFRGTIDEPTDFFRRVLGKEQRDTIIPYRSVLQFYSAEMSFLTETARRQCRCGCGRPAASRSRYASRSCRSRRSPITHAETALAD